MVICVDHRTGKMVLKRIQKSVAVLPPNLGQMTGLNGQWIPQVSCPYSSQQYGGHTYY